MEQNPNKQPTWSEETGKPGPPRILFTSVYGPYAKAGEADVQHTFSMELFDNQVTRGQGIFSPRVFHNSYGLRMIQANINAPSVLLDFPSMKRLEQELISHRYDIVGVSAIVMNLGKVQKMCEIVRRLSPHSKIIVGGHIAAIPELEKLIDANHVVRGEGISWMRGYLGEDVQTPIHHPPLRSSFDYRVLGFRIPDYLAPSSGTIIHTVGCPMGCKFCATSAFFGGKGRFVGFFKTGEELYRAMCESESALKTSDFFIMDENFLLNRRRALELLECMKKGNKAWAMQVFASANALSQYTMDELVELGVYRVWIGLESPSSKFAKLEGADTMKLVRELQSHGIEIIGSTIIGLEHHTPENVIADVENAIAHETEFHQFMLYMPFPGTPLFAEMEKEGRLLKDVDLTGFSGLDRFCFRHSAISREESNRLINWAFQTDFEKNGPSLFRFIRTSYFGWKRYKSHPDVRVRRRLQNSVGPLKTYGVLFLRTMEQLYKDRDRNMCERIRAVRMEMEEEFGLPYKIFSLLLCPVLVYAARREEERLARGQTYEPRTFVVRKNWNGD